MIDDYLDPLGSDGKPAWNDLHEGLINFFTLELIENFPEAKQKIQSFWDSKKIQAIEFSNQQMETAQKNLALRIEDRKQNCLKILEQLNRLADFKNQDSIASLKFLITKLESRMNS